MRCAYCGSNSHTLRNCPKTAEGQSNRRSMYCSYCGSRAHSIEACPKTWPGNAARAWNPQSIEDNMILDHGTDR